jgi:hypothetical protein
MKSRCLKRLVVLPLLLLALFSASLAYGYSYELFIQPIQVGDQNNHWANSARELYQSAMQKIWDQAGIKITFLPWNSFDSATYYLLNPDTEFWPLVNGAGHGQNANPRVINMFFVHTITGAYGIGAWPGNGIAVADDVFSYPPNGRLDTMAHETGHNLGLGHDDYGAGGANNLMTAGGDRSIPATTADIYPDGLDLDQLLQAQIARAIAIGTDPNYNFLYPIPLPGTVVLLGSGLGFLIFWRPRR